MFLNFNKEKRKSIKNTCCLSRSTFAKWRPTSAERLTHTPQGLSITPATVTKVAGQVIAAIKPDKKIQNKLSSYSFTEML